MTIRRRGSALAAITVFALVAAACGSDDSDGESTSATVDAGVQGELEEQFEAGEEATTGEEGDEEAAPLPQSMEEWEELWAEERAAVVERIKENGWGKTEDGTKIVGPAGFEIDLTQCPQNWSDTEGLTDTEIKIGQPTALSGTLADYGNINRGMIALLETWSEEGYFTDSEGKTRSVNVILKDDGYDPARTIPLVDELLDRDRVFAIETLGSPSTMRTYDKINERCVPHPYPITGHPAWGDPVEHPWTTHGAFSYGTEALLWGQFIEDRLDEFGGEVTVASLVMNNDFGKSYDSAFQAYIENSENGDAFNYISETIEPSAPTVKDPMTTLAAQNPDVFISMTAGVSCTQAIQEAAENGMKDNAAYLFNPATCAASTFVSADKIGGDGSASDGWWNIRGGLRDITSSGEDDNAYIVWAREQIEEAGLDPLSSGSFSNGAALGWMFSQALAVAGELDGGLTRSNFITALRAIEGTNPMLVEGIEFKMNGAEDGYAVEGSDIARWNAAEQRWEPAGTTIDLSGSTPNCVWDQAAGACQ